MSLPVKIFSAALCLLLLSSCGFKSVYSKKSSGEVALANRGVYIEPISGGKAEHQFKIELEDRLNPSGRIPADPAYSLSVTLSSSISAIGVARDGTVSRYNVYMKSSYVLRDYKTKEKITSGVLQQVSSYNNRVNEYFSTYISNEDAIKRGVTALSETYRQRLAPFLNGQRPPAKEDKEAGDEGKK